MARTGSKRGAGVLSSDELSQFARACVSLGNDVADGSGFVSVRSLLQRFQAEIIIRPLLVEGMLAVTQNSAHGTGQPQWTVLVNSDSHPISFSDLASEAIGEALPSRFRFTVAHELVHSLAFRATEFGIRLKNPIDSDVARQEIVREIERATDQLAPLLLVSARALECLLSGGKRPSASEVFHFRRSIGVSRQVLINRFRMLSPADPTCAQARNALKNVGLCLGEWANEHQATLRSWPVFANFERNIVPRFLLALDSQDFLPAANAISSEALAACGGKSHEAELSVAAGTLQVPDAERIMVRIAMESVARTRGAQFLIMVTRIS